MPQIRPLQRVLIGQVRLLDPDRPQSAADKIRRVMSRRNHGNDQLVGKREIERPEFWLKIELDVTLGPPTLEFIPAMGLSRGVTLGQRQASGFTEQRRQADGFV